MKSIILATLMLVFFTGCSIKQEDKGLTRLTKHLINTPLYLGKAVKDTAVIGGLAVVGGVKKTGEAFSGDSQNANQVQVEENLNIND